MGQHIGSVRSRMARLRIGPRLPGMGFRRPVRRRFPALAPTRRTGRLHLRVDGAAHRRRRYAKTPRPGGCRLSVPAPGWDDAGDAPAGSQCLPCDSERRHRRAATGRDPALAFLPNSRSHRPLDSDSGAAQYGCFLRHSWSSRSRSSGTGAGASYLVRRAGDDAKS